MPFSSAFPSGQLRDLPTSFCLVLFSPQGLCFLPILPFTSTTSTFDPSVGAKLALLDLISFPLISGLPRYYLHVSPFLLKPRTCSSPYHVYRMREGACYIVMPCRL